MTRRYSDQPLNSIGLRRKGINEEIIYLDDRYFDEQAEMRSALENWSNTIDPEVLLRVPPVPDGVGNRMRDNWLPCCKSHNWLVCHGLKNAMMPFTSWR